VAESSYSIWPKLVLANFVVMGFRSDIKKGTIVAALATTTFSLFGGMPASPAQLETMDPEEIESLTQIDEVTPIPEDRQEAFASRYVLLTPGNVDEMAEKYSGLFGR